MVDTGMHALGWSRQQAVDYMLEHTAASRENIVGEVDRSVEVEGSVVQPICKGNLCYDPSVLLCYDLSCVVLSSSRFKTVPSSVCLVLYPLNIAVQKRDVRLCPGT